jgi:hypothetical protein
MRCRAHERVKRVRIGGGEEVDDALRHHCPTCVHPHTRGDSRPIRRQAHQYRPPPPHPPTHSCSTNNGPGAGAARCFTPPRPAHRAPRAAAVSHLQAANVHIGFVHVQLLRYKVAHVFKRARNDAAVQVVEHVDHSGQRQEPAGGEERANARLNRPRHYETAAGFQRDVPGKWCPEAAVPRVTQCRPHSLQNCECALSAHSSSPCAVPSPTHIPHGISTCVPTVFSRIHNT